MPISTSFPNQSSVPFGEGGLLAALGTSYLQVILTPFLGLIMSLSDIGPFKSPAFVLL